MLRTNNTTGALIVLLAVLCCSNNAAGQCIYLLDFPGSCVGRGCERAPYTPIYSEAWCEPWIGELYGYPFIKYAAYERQYDCEGDSCVCQPICYPIDMCAYDTMAECQENHNGTRIVCEDEYYAECSPGGGGFPPPDCPKDVCCLAGGGGGPGSGGGGGGGFMLTLLTLLPHSPAPRLAIHYNNKLPLDRGMGRGWSHTYMLTLHENPVSGTVTIRGETGFGWVYRSRGDGTYESAPYDRSILRKQGPLFISTLKDGTRHTYNASGKLESIADLANNMLTMTYTADGLLQKVADAHGRELQFTYEDYHLKAVLDPNGSRYGFSYQNENLSAMTFPDGSGKQFIYSNPDEPHQLTRVLDGNNNILATYAYDRQGRIIEKGNAGGTGSIEIDYAPSQEIFTDDFQNGIGPQWSEMTGTVNEADNPDPAHSGNTALRLHPGKIKFTSETGGVAALKISFDLWVASATNQDFWVKIFDSTRGSDEYGVTLKFTKERNLYSELMYNGELLREFIRSSVAAGTWHRVEIEADTKQDHGYQYFNIWLDCEYAGKFLFKRTASLLDTIAIQAQTSVSDIYIDNVAVAEVINDESMVVTTDSLGNRETLTFAPGNEFGGESWHIEKTGKTGGSCSSCGASATHYAFDDKWNIRRTIDANDVITEMTYDERGNMLSRTEAKGTPLERTTTYTYHPVFNIIASITETGVDTAGQNKVTINIYDEETANLLSKTVQGYSRGTSFVYTTAYQYNSRGQMIQEDGPRADVNDITTYTYHQTNGYLTAITSPNGTITYSGYDANHNIGSITDLNGAATNYTYDYAGRVKTVTTGSAVTTYQYDPAGNIDYVIMPEGNRVDYDYDSSNHLTKITDQQGNYFSYTYDNSGNKTREEIHDSQGTLKKYLDFTYTSFNRLSEIKNPDNSSTTFTYDSNGNRTAMETVPGDITTSYEYDELNRLKKVIQAQGTPAEAVTEYQYDPQDNLAQVKDAEGKITTYKYDDLGRLIETNSPDSGITAYSYDEAGNLKTKTDAKGVTVLNEYDALNRLSKIDFPDDPDTTYYYDQEDSNNGKGRLTELTDASGTTKFFYDERGNVTKQQSIIEGLTFITQYEYNRNNQIIRIIYPSGKAVDYLRSPIGNISAVMLDGETIVDGMKYEPFGELNEMNFAANGIQTKITRNNKYQITSIQAGNIVNRAYTHDFDGNINSIKQLDSLPRPIIYSGTDTYAYQSGKDWLNTVTNETDTQTYRYDENGNITADGKNTYLYNANNQLIKVLNGTVKGEYIYNGKAQRVKKTADGQNTLYHYDLAGNLIEETMGDGTLIADYIYAGSYRIARVAADSSIYYYHNDHLGTPLAMTNAQGTPVWKTAYDPFGKAQVEQSSTITNNFRFPGQYYDGESGLHYNWYRYYDPRTGKYVTADPIGIEHGNNHLYIYVKNNPIKLKDIKGLDTAGCDGIPDFLETPCRLICCASHDECYDKKRCKSSSWTDECASKECIKCNKEVAQCFLSCLIFTDEYSDEPEYYCRHLHKYINIPGDFPDYATAKIICEENY